MLYVDPVSHDQLLWLDDIRFFASLQENKKPEIQSLCEKEVKRLRLGDIAKKIQSKYIFQAFNDI